jgi:TPR repeat protein
MHWNWLPPCKKPYTKMRWTADSGATIVGSFAAPAERTLVIKSRIAACILLLALASGASADYTAAATALQQQDFATAFPLMHKSAEAGDVQAMNALATMYWNGQGTDASAEQSMIWLKKAAALNSAPAMNTLAKLYMTGSGVNQDALAARSWAEKSAKLGDADGEVAYYLSVISGPELNFHAGDAPDTARYDALAARSLGERTLDQQAYAMLGKALDQNNPTAKLYAVAEMVDKVGPGNRSRALALMKDLPELPGPLQTVQAALDTLSHIGDSYATFSIFVSAKDQAIATAAVLGQRSGVLTAGGCGADDLKIKATSISRPLANAVYLPATQPQLQKLYLITGNWQEKWVFDACGKSVEVPVEFQADGLGGAKFQAPAPGAATAK